MSQKYAILITGARDWSDKEMILDALSKYKAPDTILIQGDCVGADKIAQTAGKELGFEVTTFPAEWKKYGRAAGPVRNKLMVDTLIEYKENGYNIIVIACHDNLELSKGTKNCVNYALKNKIPIEYLKH